MNCSVHGIGQVPGQDGKQINMVIVRENTECLVSWRFILLTLGQLLTISTGSCTLAVRQARRSYHSPRWNQEGYRYSSNHRAGFEQDRKDGLRVGFEERSGAGHQPLGIFLEGECRMLEEETRQEAERNFTIHRDLPRLPLSINPTFSQLPTACSERPCERSRRTTLTDTAVSTSRSRS